MRIAGELTGAYALGNNGWITGAHFIGPPAYAFRWQGGVGELLEGFPGGGHNHNTGGASINSSGAVAGFASDDGVPFAAYWDANGFHNLGNLGRGSAYASAINDSGWVAGYGGVASGGTHAFVYRGGQMLDIGRLGLPGVPFTQVDTIKNLGIVLGFDYDPHVTHQYGWYWSDGTGMVQLPPVSGDDLTTRGTCSRWAGGSTTSTRSSIATCRCCGAVSP